MTPEEVSAHQARYEGEVARQWAQGPSDGAHDLGHLRRVWRAANLIAMDEENVDRRVLLAACFFHDLVNVPKDSVLRRSASRLSAEAACTFLREDGFDPTKVHLVAHAIEAHSFSAGIAAETIEAKILQDADRLEALGAIGIARMFHVAGSMGGGLFDPADPMAQHRPLDDRQFALDHIQTKLQHLAAKMHTATGRAMANERTDWMLSFRTRLLAEIK
ncbi:MAG: HD domain-containing protein [Microgenomates group bacterium]